jgi:hypothetical protein
MHSISTCHRSCFDLLGKNFENIKVKKSKDEDQEKVEIELENGDLIEVPLPLFKRAWGRWCAMRRETHSGGRNGGIRTPEATAKRLKTMAKNAKKNKKEAAPIKTKS